MGIRPVYESGKAYLGLCGDSFAACEVKRSKLADRITVPSHVLVVWYIGWIMILFGQDWSKNPDTTRSSAPQTRGNEFTVADK